MAFFGPSKIFFINSQPVGRDSWSVNNEIWGREKYVIIFNDSRIFMKINSVHLGQCAYLRHVTYYMVDKLNSTKSVGVMTSLFVIICGLKRVPARDWSTWGGQHIWPMAQFLPWGAATYDHSTNRIVRTHLIIIQYRNYDWHFLNLFERHFKTEKYDRYK